MHEKCLELCMAHSAQEMLAITVIIILMGISLKLHLKDSFRELEGKRRNLLGRSE